MNFAPSHSQVPKLHYTLIAQNVVRKTHRLREDIGVVKALQKGGRNPRAISIDVVDGGKEHDAGEDQLFNGCPDSGKMHLHGY